MKFQWLLRDNDVRLALRGWSGIVVLIALLSSPFLLSLQCRVTKEQAIDLIRQHLRFQAGERYAELYRRGKIDAAAGRLYQEELRSIDGLRFECIKVGRLLPDYLFSVRPTYFAKATVRDDNGVIGTRYFNLGKGFVVM